MSLHVHTGNTQPAAPIDADHQQRLMDGARCLAEALRLLQMGLSPLALCHCTHLGVERVSPGHLGSCTSPGKRPIVPWKRYQQAQPTRAEVEGWWSLYPIGGLGMALGGPGRPLRVDTEGEQVLEQLRQIARGRLPVTWSFRSGRRDRRGFGLLFLAPDGVNIPTTVETFAD